MERWHEEQEQRQQKLMEEQRMRQALKQHKLLEMRESRLESLLRLKPLNRPQSQRRLHSANPQLASLPIQLTTLRSESTELTQLQECKPKINSQKAKPMYLQAQIDYELRQAQEALQERKRALEQVRNFKRIVDREEIQKHANQYQS